MNIIEAAEQTWLPILDRELTAEMSKAPAVSAAHDAKHIHRVWRNAKTIAASLPVDSEILIAAVFLHDLGRHTPEGSGVHGPISAPIARSVLERINFPATKIHAAILAIQFHDETFTTHDRASLEAKVLYDADKLDAFGAIGIARSLLFYTQRGKTLGEIADITRENLRLRFQNLELEDTRLIAREKLDYVNQFFTRLKGEL